MQLLLQTLGVALVWQTQRVHPRLFYAACGMLPMTICLLWPGERRDLMTLLGLKWSATNYAALVITCVMTMLLQTGPIILLGLAKNEQTRLSASPILRDPLLATLAFRLGLVPVLMSYDDIQAHEKLGHLVITPGSFPDGPPVFFQCPLLPVKNQ